MPIQPTPAAEAVPSTGTATATMVTPELDLRWRRVQARMEASRPVLVRNAWVVSQHTSPTTRVWTLRYRENCGDRRLQRNIYLGPPELADRARHLLGEWRAQTRVPEQRRRKEMSYWLGIMANAREYSGRARRRLQKAVAAAASNPRQAFQLAVGLQHDDDRIRFGRPRGRAFQSGLW